MFFSFLLSCNISSSLDSSSRDSAEPIQEESYTVLLMADPHLAGGEEHRLRLQKAVEWANAERIALGIEMVIVLGDIGWR